jgi:hypothetical protein
MYPLQRRAVHQIVWPALLIFRPASFCLDRSSKVESLPINRPLYVRRQTPLPPVFPKDDIPQLIKTQATDIALKQIGAVLFLLRSSQ